MISSRHITNAPSSKIQKRERKDRHLSIERKFKLRSVHLPKREEGGAGDDMNKSRRTNFSKPSSQESCCVRPRRARIKIIYSDR